MFIRIYLTKNGLRQLCGRAPAAFGGGSGGSPGALRRPLRRAHLAYGSPHHEADAYFTPGFILHRQGCCTWIVRRRLGELCAAAAEAVCCLLVCWCAVCVSLLASLGLCRTLVRDQLLRNLRTNKFVSPNPENNLLSCFTPRVVKI